MKIVYLGSAEFGIPSLEKILEHHEVSAVVSLPARPKGRGLHLVDTPIVEFAKANNIAPIFTPDDLNEENFLQELSLLNADLFVVIAFRILPKVLFTIPKFGTLNVHASLLPKYRGAAPIHRAIEAGETESGVTVFKIDEGVDTGGIVAQKKLSVYNDETTPELYERLSKLGAETLIESIDHLTNGNIEIIPQDSALASRAPKLSKQEGRINWNLSAQEIFNKIRAFKPFPGTYFYLNGKKINIEWGVVENCCDDNNYNDVNNNVNNNNNNNDNNKVVAGTILSAEKDSIKIKCGKGILAITKIKPEGKPAMDVKAFLLGHTIKKGTVIE